MKGKRLLATMLALLLVVSLLPMAAMADDLPDNTVSQVPISQPIGTNSGIAVEITQSGSVQTNTGSVAENEGTVVNNNGKVTGNMDGGTVVNNNAGATVQFNNAGATVQNNNAGAAVENNNAGGIIEHNSGYVGEWRPDVQQFQTTSGNKGTVGDNTSTGKVNNLAGGEVGSNSGTVYNNAEGSVVQMNEVDGYVANNSLGPDADGPKVEINFGTVQYAAPSDNDQPTYYGVHYEVDGKKVYINQFKADTDVSISELKISRPGYKLVNCQAVEKYDRSEPTRFADVTDDDDTTKNEDGSVRSFTVWAPTRLTLLWEKIASVFKPASNEPEAKPVKAAALPSTVAAEDVKVGTVVRVKGQLFRVIEMDDGSMTVVTMGKLSKKDMEDLTAFLAKYFTPEQIELLLGDPELISGALAEELFGGNTGHIVFKAASNLFA